MIDSITPDLLNLGDEVPTDYNEVYDIISKAVQVVKATYGIGKEYQLNNDFYVDYFMLFCHCHNLYRCVLASKRNIVLVRSIVQEIIK